MIETGSGRARRGGSGRDSRLRGFYSFILWLAILGLTAWLVVLFECKISG